MTGKPVSLHSLYSLDVCVLQGFHNSLPFVLSAVASEALGCRLDVGVNIAEALRGR